MSQRVFLDVGAHHGQTLLGALQWDFDWIACFEPARVNHPRIEARMDARTILEPFGLWKETLPGFLYNPGYKGAALWSREGMPNEPELCQFVKASDWTRKNLQAGDRVWMKLNVEGAELDILEDLLDSGELSKIAYVMVSWDARKIPELKARLAHVQKRVAAHPGVVSSNDVQEAKTQADHVNNWLRTTRGITHSGPR